MLEAAKTDPGAKEAMTQAAVEAEKEVVAPLFQFRNWGQQLPHHWSTISNEAAFGTDYFTRTAVAKSNILVNAPNETKYFYQDLDAAGARLNGAQPLHRDLPQGLDAAGQRLLVADALQRSTISSRPTPIGRYSVGTKNKDLKYDADGSLTLYVQADPPPDDQLANWLPTPREADGKGDFSLYIRAYGPKAAVLEGAWTPPPVENAN